MDTIKPTLLSTMVADNTLFLTLSDAMASNLNKKISRSLMEKRVSLDFTPEKFAAVLGYKLDEYLKMEQGAEFDGSYDFSINQIIHMFSKLNIPFDVTCDDESTDAEYIYKWLVRELVRTRQIDTIVCDHKTVCLHDTEDDCVRCAQRYIRDKMTEELEAKQASGGE